MRVCSIFCIAFFAIFLNGCFLTSLFDLGPKIDLAKSGSWKIASFNLDGISYEPKGFDETPHIRFDVKELRLNGNTGCNMFFATYTWLDDKNIEVRNSGMTRKMCHPESMMKFEQKLMEEFEGDFEVIEEGEQITLKRENLQIILTPIALSSEMDKGVKQDDQADQNTNPENLPKEMDEFQMEPKLDSQFPPLPNDDSDIKSQDSISNSYQSSNASASLRSSISSLSALHLATFTTFPVFQKFTQMTLFDPASTISFYLES